MDVKEVARDAARRREILDGARACFLQYGYAKTSLDDIAKRVGISRPLIYRKFKNKEAVFSAVYDDLLDARYAQADAVLAARGSKRDKLVKLCELFVMDTWVLMMSSPNAVEFYDACEQVLPEVHAKHDRRMLEYAKELIGSKELAEVFMLAVEGLMTDLPSVATLRKRVATLIDRFI